MKLSREQKKIIYITGVILLSFLLFWSFIYQPQSRRLKEIKQQLKVAEEEITRIRKLAQGRTMEEAVKDLNLRLNQAAAELPSKEKAVIEALSNEAKKLKIAVPVIDPADELKLLAGSIPGVDLEELPVSLQLICEYKALGEYLDILRNKFPYLIKIRQFVIQGGPEGNISLNVNMEISAFLSK